MVCSDALPWTNTCSRSSAGSRAGRAASRRRSRRRPATVASARSSSSSVVEHVLGPVAAQPGADEEVARRSRDQHAGDQDQAERDRPSRRSAARAVAGCCAARVAARAGGCSAASGARRGVGTGGHRRSHCGPLPVRLSQSSTGPADQASRAQPPRNGRISSRLAGRLRRDAQHGRAEVAGRRCGSAVAPGRSPGRASGAGVRIGGPPDRPDPRSGWSPGSLGPSAGGVAGRRPVLGRRGRLAGEHGVPGRGDLAQ